MKPSLLTIIEPVLESGPILAWYLRAEAGRRSHSVMLTFGPEGTTIAGDLVSTGWTYRGGSLRWFAADMAPSYLAGKFLPRVWSKKAAEDYCADLLGRQGEDALPYDARMALEDAKADGDWSEVAWVPVATALRDIGFDCEEVAPSYRPDECDSETLAAIHGAFRCLFWERWASIDAAGQPSRRIGGVA